MVVVAGTIQCDEQVGGQGIDRTVLQARVQPLEGLENVLVKRLLLIDSTSHWSQEPPDEVEPQP
eukprot:6257041-Lingulodinium_polyedra.AAC.1